MRLDYTSNKYRYTCVIRVYSDLTIDAKKGIMVYMITLVLQGRHSSQSPRWTRKTCTWYSLVFHTLCLLLVLLPYVPPQYVGIRCVQQQQCKCHHAAATALVLQLLAWQFGRTGPFPSSSPWPMPAVRIVIFFDKIYKSALLKSQAG